MTGSVLTGKGGIMMVDREKIISAIEKAKKQSEEYELDRIIVSLKVVDIILALLKEQKTGHWIFGCSMRQQWVKCDICGTTQTHCWPYCPNCGAAMLREELKLFD